MLILIDGDILTYRAGFACEKKDKETGELHVEPVRNAVHNVKSMIMKILMRLESSNYRIFLTEVNDKTNFRSVIFPDYKANRKDMKRPEHYQAIRDYLVKFWNAEVCVGYEADDALSLAQWADWEYSKIKNIEPDSCIATLDKDLDIVPGWHYNFAKDFHYYHGELDGLRCFYKQMLVGDRVDNIPRLFPRMRFKEQFKVIDSVETEAEMLQVVRDTINKHTANPDGSISPTLADSIITFRGRLLWPRKTTNEMWSPPSL